MPRNRPRLSSAVACVRHAVRTSLKQLLDDRVTRSSRGGPNALMRVPSLQQTSHADAESVCRVLVGLSGGADSLALADAVAFESPKLGIQAGAIIVDHRLQEHSDVIAQQAADQAQRMGLSPVLIRTVEVTDHAAGPEAAARNARYAAFEAARLSTQAARVCVAHTLNDQAETVLLGLARGSGVKSIWGMSADTGTILRPLLGVSSAQTRQACQDRQVQVWNDPHNQDVRYKRVRVRHEVLPLLEEVLNPNIVHSLARTGQLVRESEYLLDYFVDEMLHQIRVDECEYSQIADQLGSKLAVGQHVVCVLAVDALVKKPEELIRRIIQRVCHTYFAVSLSWKHAHMVCQLVTNWRGQGAAYLPSVCVVRQHGLLVFIQ